MCRQVTRKVGLAPFPVPLHCRSSLPFQEGSPGQEGKESPDASWILRGKKGAQRHSLCPTHPLAGSGDHINGRPLIYPYYLAGP